MIDAETGEPVAISQVVLCTFTRTPDRGIVLDGCRTADFAQARPGEFSVDYSYPTEYHLRVSADGYEDGEAFTPPVTCLEDVKGVVVKMRARVRRLSRHRDFGKRSSAP